MAKCVSLQRKVTKICAGSLNRKVGIYATDITSPLDPMMSEVDYGEKFTLIASPWAMVEDINGEVLFDGVSTDDVPTTRFYIRYLAGITAENWVKLDGINYNITKVDNLDHNKRFMSLETNIRGDELKDATRA